MPRVVLHVEARMKGQWALRRDGAVRAAKLFGTQSEAIRAARHLARQSKSELFIHRQDGRVQEMEIYSQDPLPSSGRK